MARPVRTVWIEKQQYLGVDGNRHSVVLSSQDEENSTGISPSELLLVSLAGCTSYDVVNVLQKKRQRLQTGQTFPLSSLGPFHLPDPATGIPERVWETVVQALEAQAASQDAAPPPQVQNLVEKRETTRTRSDWQEADQLRARISALGWTIQDTGQGPRLMPSDRAPSS